MKEKALNWTRGALRSLTVWFNSAAAIIVMALPEIQNTLPQLSAYLGPDVYRYMALAVVLANVVLRAKTKKSLSEKGSTSA